MHFLLWLRLVLLNNVVHELLLGLGVLLNPLLHRLHKLRHLILIYVWILSLAGLKMVVINLHMLIIFAKFPWLLTDFLSDYLNSWSIPFLFCSSWKVWFKNLVIIIIITILLELVKRKFLITTLIVRKTIFIRLNMISFVSVHFFQPFHFLVHRSLLWGHQV